MTDYVFAPDDMVWHVGERVSLTVINNTQAHPGRRHEFMMGREPNHVETPFGVHYEGGFAHDFFTGMSVELSHSAGVEMVMPGEAELAGPDADQPFIMQDMSGPDMGGMEMGSEQSPMPGISPSPSMDMPPGEDTTSMPGMTMLPTPEDMSSMPGMTMTPTPEDMGSMPGMGETDGMDHTPGSPGGPGDMDMGDEMDGADDHATEQDAHGMGEMGHHGFMVELRPDGAATISFIVPDKPGTWEYGCFAETGQHYENGMRGTVTIIR